MSTLIHELNPVKLSILSASSTPIYAQTVEVRRHSCVPSSQPLDYLEFPPGRLLLHSDFTLQEGFPSLFLRPCPVDGKEPGHSDTTHSQRPCRTTMAYDDSMKKEGMTPYSEAFQRA